MDISHMTPRRPYLLRAFYDWLLDNQLTPHAVGNLELGDDEVRFNARFGGVPRQVSVPMAAVQAIYARENGAGSLFEPEAAYAVEGTIESLDNKTNPVESLISVVDSNRPETSDGDEPPPSGGRLGWPPPGTARG
ncbi:ClpXP protease specificity-enhancing factor SspB [Serratia symbiotica]|uniref:ClpXP protease specificity-enhancing factor SspB n=1 Tax=Serratia symbiotica TaxID=138074 RepID=UPI003D9A7F2E